MVLRIAMLVLAVFAALPAAAQMQTGAFSLTFRDDGPRGALEIEVPAVAARACAAKPCPLVIAMHGVTRNAFRPVTTGWISPKNTG